MIHQHHDANRSEVRNPQGTLDAIRLLLLPPHAPHPTPLVAQKMARQIGGDSGARRAEPWLAESNQPPRTFPQHHPAPQALPIRPQGQAEPSIRGLLRIRQRLRKHSPRNQQIRNPLTNQAPAAADAVVAAVAAVPDPPEIAAARNASKISPTKLPSPALPVTGSLHPAVAHRDPEMPWWNRNGSIGKMN